MTSHAGATKHILYPGHSVKRQPPTNYAAGDSVIFVPEDFTTRVRDVHCVTIESAVIIGQLIFQNHRLLHDYCRHTPTPRLDVAKAHIKRYVDRRRSFNRAYAAIGQWSDNYFHWLTELYPSILASRRSLVGLPLLMPRHYLAAAFIREGLELFDIEPTCYGPREVLLVDELIATNEPIVGHYNVPFLLDMKTQLEARVAPAHNASRRLFISRSKAKNKGILNESEVIHALAGFEFETLCTEDLTFRNQIEMMQEARIVVGAHGSGLTNCLFMPRGGAVYELKAHNNTYNSFFALARAVGLEYYYQRCASDDPNHRVSNVIVDIDVLRRDVDAIVRQMSG
jgi:capsular polysaccharide biosynthesis protein